MGTTPELVETGVGGKGSRLERWFWRLLCVLLGVGIAGWWSYTEYLCVEPQDVVLLVQRELTIGAEFAPRVIVRDRRNGKGVEGASVSVELTGQGGLRCRGVTDASGSLDLRLRVPNDATSGERILRVAVGSWCGSDLIDSKVILSRPARLALSLDKPRYQPGQTIHMRAYVASQWDGKPMGGCPAVFEARDGKGNLVFRNEVRTSTFGIAAADFTLATEVNLGSYAIRFVCGADEALRAVDVTRYTLPAYKVDVTFDKPWWIVGEAITGKVRASYFFCEPVAGAAVLIRPDAVPGGKGNAKPIEGVTGKDGSCSFTLSSSEAGIVSSKDDGIDLL